MEGDAPLDGIYLEIRGQGITPEWMKSSEADSIASEQTKTYNLYIALSTVYIVCAYACILHKHFQCLQVKLLAS